MAVLFRVVWPKINRAGAYNALNCIDGVAAYLLAAEPGLAKGGQIIAWGAGQEAVIGHRFQVSIRGGTEPGIVRPSSPNRAPRLELGKAQNGVGGHIFILMAYLKSAGRCNQCFQTPAGRTERTKQKR